MKEGEPLFTPEEIKRLRRLRRIVIMGAGMIGLSVSIGLVMGFFIAAPKPKEDVHHRFSVPDRKCLSCHEFGQKGPLMPHRPFPACLICHRPYR